MIFRKNIYLNPKESNGPAKDFSGQRLSGNMSQAKLQILINSALRPKKGEKMLFVTDEPNGSLDAERQDRRDLLLRWLKAASNLSKKAGFQVLPLLKYAEPGKHNAHFPSDGLFGGEPVSNLVDIIKSADIVVAMTTYSQTADLKGIATQTGSVRGLSMPTVVSSNESAMSVDHDAMNELGSKAMGMVKTAVGFEVIFKGRGVAEPASIYVDARHANWHMSPGFSRNPGDGFTNLPGAEFYCTPYEGVHPDALAAIGESQTKGAWPVYSAEDGQTVFLRVEKNRIVEVPGDSAFAKKLRNLIKEDPNAANVAELGFGLNPNARLGNVLEEEKAGIHIAYGKNVHFGKEGSWSGVVDASTHQDVVYAHISPIRADVYAVFEDGRRMVVALGGKVIEPKPL